MSNPWLDVPLDAYEGHMKSPEVGQLDALSDLFAESLACCRPVSVAVLGIAGGNGLDRIDGNITERVAGLDVNPLYLDAVRRRYPALPGLELWCLDLAEQVVHLEPVKLVHAALLFEHTGVGLCLENALSLVAPGGSLSVVVQLPGESGEGVGATTRFPSIENLRSHFSIIDPIELQETLDQRKFRMTREARRSLPSGKGLWMGIFGRE